MEKKIQMCVYLEHYLEQALFLYQYNYMKKNGKKIAKTEVITDALIEYFNKSEYLKDNWKSINEE